MERCKMVLPMVTRICRTLLSTFGFFPIAVHVRRVRLLNSGCDACSEIIQYCIASARIARIQGHLCRIYRSLASVQLLFSLLGGEKRGILGRWDSCAPSSMRIFNWQFQSFCHDTLLILRCFQQPSCAVCHYGYHSQCPANFDPAFLLLLEDWHERCVASFSLSQMQIQGSTPRCFGEQEPLAAPDALLYQGYIPWIQIRTPVNAVCTAPL